MRAPLCWPRALLLTALLFSCSGTETDPLPVALVELVKSGAVSSAEDLQLLLLSDSVEDEPGSNHANNTNNRLPRSLLDALPAQQAQCKVRTEVMEVTRSMLDRSNANFLLWPPCVEVQRCSGCCNTKNLKCVPVLTHTRYLQVMKIQYANTRPVYNKVVVSVNDHVECRCQPAPRLAPRRKSTTHKQETRERSGKPRNKDEFLRRDDLKPNQKLKIEDLLGHSWFPMVKQSDSMEDQGHDARGLNKTYDGRGRVHYHGDDRKDNGSYTERQRVPLSNYPYTEETGFLVHNVTKEKIREKELLHTDSEDLQLKKYSSEYNQKHISKKNVSGIAPADYTNRIPEELIPVQRNESSFHPGTNLNHEHNEPSSLQLNQTDRTSHFPPKEINQKQGESSEEDSERMKENETPQSERTPASTEATLETRSSTLLFKEKKALEEEKEELLLLHKRLDDEKQKHSLKVQHSKQSHPHHKQQTELTSSTPVKVTTTYTPPQPPPRPQKRWRKHRNRISKAVMRAMLM